MTNAWILFTTTDEETIIVLFREIAAVMTDKLNLIIILNNRQKLIISCRDRTILQDTLRQIRTGLILEE